MKILPYSLAAEIDRTLKLELSNGQFDALAVFLDGYQDSRKIAKELFMSSREDLLILIAHIRSQI